MTAERNEDSKDVVDVLIPKSDSQIIKVLSRQNSNGNVDKIRSTKEGVFHQILVTGAILILAAACGMPIGYSAVILPQLYNSSDPLSMDIDMGSWFASVHSLATPVGAFASGPIADKFGRRPALLLSIFPLIIGWILLATSSSHFWLIAGRITAGIAVGLIGAPAQILIAEIAEPHLRGVLIGAPFVSYSMGILFVYALGSGLHWRHVAWCGIILPILSAVAIFFAPESPAWLAQKGYLKKASKSLEWLRCDDLLAKNELNKLIERFENEKLLSKTANTNNFFKIIFKQSTIKPLIIINVFNLLQILSGTYLIVFYVVDIISEFSTQINISNAAVMTAIVRLICTFIVCFLLLTMKRRTMTIMSGLGSGLSSIILGIYMIFQIGKPKTLTDAYVSGICIIVYVAFNSGFMAMPGVMLGELLPAKIRGQIAGYILALFNLTLFAVTKLFPIVRFTINTHGLFILFGLSSFAASLFIYLMLPETKESTLGEIEDYFSDNNWFWINRKKQQKTNQNEQI